MGRGSWGGWWYIHGGRWGCREVIGVRSVLKLHVSADEGGRERGAFFTPRLLTLGRVRSFAKLR